MPSLSPGQSCDSMDSWLVEMKTTKMARIGDGEILSDEVKSEHEAKTEDVNEPHATIDGDDRSTDVKADALLAAPSSHSQLSDNQFDWIKLANHAYDTDDLENAKLYYLRALDFLDEQADADQCLRLLCLNRVGDICLRLKQPDEAFQIFARAKTYRQMSTSGMLVLNFVVLVLTIVSCLSIEFPVASNNGESFLLRMAVAHAASDNAFISPIRPSAEFKTADQLSTVKIADSKTLYRWDHGEVWGVKYLTPNFSFGDILKLVSGCRKKNEHFVLTRNDSLVDDAGLIFYRPDAPEVKLVEQIWWYASFVNYYYGEFKKYPTSEDPWMPQEVGYRYTNPFTKQIEKPEYVTLGQQNEDPPASGKPGAILILSTSTGDCTVCGYDRNGQLVTSSNPGKPLLLQLRKGVNVTDQHLKSFGGKNRVRTSDAKEIFVFMNDPSVKGLIKGAETYLPAIVLPFWLSSLTLSLFLYRVSHKSPGRLLSLSPMLVPSIFVVMVLFMSYGE